MAMYEGQFSKKLRVFSRTHLWSGRGQTFSESRKRRALSKFDEILQIDEENGPDGFFSASLRAKVTQVLSRWLELDSTQAFRFINGLVAGTPRSLQEDLLCAVKEQGATTLSFLSLSKICWDRKSPYYTKLFACLGTTNKREASKCWVQLGIVALSEKHWNVALHCFRKARDIRHSDKHTRWFEAIATLNTGRLEDLDDMWGFLERDSENYFRSELLLKLYALFECPKTKPFGDVDHRTVASEPRFVCEYLCEVSNTLFNHFFGENASLPKSWLESLASVPGDIIHCQIWRTIITQGISNDDFSRKYLESSIISKESKEVVNAVELMRDRPSNTKSDYQLMLSALIGYGSHISLLRTLDEIPQGLFKFVEVNDLLEKGISKSKHRSERRELIEAFAKMMPNDSSMILFLAKYLYESGFIKEAKAKIVRLEDDSEDVNYLKACIAFVENDRQVCIENLEKILSKGESRRALSLLGDVYFDLGRFVESAEVWSRVNSIKHSFSSHLNLAVAKRSQGLHEEASQAAISACRLARNQRDFRRSFYIWLTENWLTSGAPEIIEHVMRANLIDDNMTLHFDYLNSIGNAYIPRLNRNTCNNLHSDYYNYSISCLRRLGSNNLQTDVKSFVPVCTQPDFEDHGATGVYIDVEPFKEYSLPIEEVLLQISASLIEKNPVQFERAMLHLEEKGQQDESLEKWVKNVGAFYANKVNLNKTPSEWFYPRVSIVVPAHNEARFLSDCLNSVLLQSYCFWECIIVDDASSDMTFKIASDYAKRDSRFKIISTGRNIGLAAARNCGLENARGQFITFLDADDFISVDSILNRVIVLERASDGCVAGSYCGVSHCPERLSGSISLSGPAKGTLGVKSAETSLFESPFNVHAPLCVTDLLKKFGGFDSSMTFGVEDWNLWRRLLSNGYYFVPHQSIGAFYRAKRGSMVRTLSTRHFFIALGECEKYFGPRLQKVESDQEKFNSIQLVSANLIARRAIPFATMAYLSGDLEGFHLIMQRVPFSFSYLSMKDSCPKRLVKVGVTRYFAQENFERIGLSPRILIEELTNTVLEEVKKVLPERNKWELVGELFKNNPIKSGGNVSAVEYLKVEEKEQHSTGSRLKYELLEEPAYKLSDSSRLREFRDTHKGKRCFVVGNGPSLNKLDLKKLDGEITIGVNGIFYKTDEMGFKPTYYVVEDTSVMKENIDRIKDFDAEAKFFPSIYRKLHPRGRNVYFFSMNRGYYEPRSPNYKVPRFSTDFSERAYCGQSVTYINLQLAFYMGFSEVYLIGMDFDYTIPKSFERSGNIITSTGDDPNHFHPDYFGKGKTWKDPKLDRVLANYKMAALVYESADKKIYNATAGGKLEIFERVAFDSLF